MIKLVALVIVILLIFGGGAYLLPKLTGKTLTNPFASNSQPFFDSESSVLSGKITKMDGNKMTIENSRGQTREFKVTESYTVFDPTFVPDQNNKAPEGTPSQKKPEVGKTVTVTFQLINGEYMVTGLSYLPEITGSPKPAATPDANYERERAKFSPPPINPVRPATPSATSR